MSDCGCGPQDALSLVLFASFEAYIDGEPLNGRVGGKARQLLKVLAANYRRPLSKDALIEVLWPDADPMSGGTSLKVTAHKLRTALDSSKKQWVVMEHGTYRLNPEIEVWIDAEEFHHHYERGRALQAGGRPAEAARELEKAKALYRGDYLAEDVYDEWTVIRREELRDLYLDTLQRLALLALDAQAHADVIRYCHKIVLEDPCREDAYRMLMRSHAALNQYARAGAWYAVCRNTVLREMGAPPTAETIQAFENLFAPVDDEDFLNTRLNRPA